MNIKDRLRTFKETPLIIKDDFSANNFFKRNNNAENLIIKAFNERKNIIILCDKNCDKELSCNYIKSLNNISYLEVIQNTKEDLEYSTCETVLITEPQITDIVNLLKSNITNFKTFIFAMNAKSYNNIINTLTTLILLEEKNLNISNVEHLIGSSEAKIVNISQDEDGLYFVKNIGEILYKNNTPTLNTIYPDINAEPIIKFEIQEQEPEISISENLQIEEVVNDEIIPEESEEREVKEEPRDEEEQIESEELVQDIIQEEQADFAVIEESNKKINKYKLLREKIKNKRIKE